MLRAHGRRLDAWLGDLAIAPVPLTPRGTAPVLTDTPLAHVVEVDRRDALLGVLLKFEGAWGYFLVGVLW